MLIRHRCVGIDWDHGARHQSRSSGRFRRLYHLGIPSHLLETPGEGSRPGTPGLAGGGLWSAGLGGDHRPAPTGSQDDFHSPNRGAALCLRTFHRRQLGDLHLGGNHGAHCRGQPGLLHQPPGECGSRNDFFLRGSGTDPFDRIASRLGRSGGDDPRRRRLPLAERGFWLSPSASMVSP